MKIAIISKLTPEHPAWKHGKRLDVKIFTQLYPGGPQYYCGNGKYCEDMEAAAPCACLYFSCFCSALAFWKLLAFMSIRNSPS